MKRDWGVVNRAIQDTQARFPFPEYFQDTAEMVEGIAGHLEGLAPQGSRLLDIGCGALDKTAVFQRMGYQCFACDDFQDPWHRQAANLESVLSFAHDVGIEVHVQEGDYTIPWQTASFDIVTMSSVIEHLHESPREILNFAGAYLKPGGLLVVAMPNSVNLRKRLAVILGRSNYPQVRGFYEYIGPWRGHVREYTLKETCQIVQWNGFDVVYKKTFHGMLRRRLHNRFPRGLYISLCTARPGYRDSVFVAARKPADWVPRQPDHDAMWGSLDESVPRGVM